MTWRARRQHDNEKNGLAAGRSGQAVAEASKAAAAHAAQRAADMGRQLDSSQDACSEQSRLIKELQVGTPCYM